MAVTGAIAGFAGLLYGQYKQGEDAKKAQEKAQKQAQENADRAAAQADQAFNAANPKTPDIAALLTSNTKRKNGIASTFLTGGSGSPRNPLGGNSSLLGG